MKLYLHTCCAVCLAGIVPELRRARIEFTAFFHNPNVHPLIEWRKRLKATRVLAEREKFPLDVDATYGLVEFLAATADKPDAPARCETCCRMRLTRTAEEAKRKGFDAFSTTLLGSTEQDLELIRRVAREVWAATGVAFHDADWRGTHDAGKELARKMSLYRQQYCGCIFSEYERYKDTNLHL
jgi:hypothetical protein